jgi:hypothetical protein
MSQDNDHTGAADAGDIAAAHARSTSLGVGIGLGAGLGLVAGLLFDSVLLGMLSGAGIGTVVVALYELWRRPAAREKGKHDG